MGGFAASSAEWDESFFKKVFEEVYDCIKAVTKHHKTLAVFRAIAVSLPQEERPAGGTEPLKFGDTRYGSRVMMGMRMKATRMIYERLLVHAEYKTWLASQDKVTKDKVSIFA